MIEGRLIICLASSWDIDPTSKHHLMRLLSRRNRIIWVNYHASRAPTLSRGDLRSIAGVGRRIIRGASSISPRMAQVTPLVLPGSASPFRDAVNRVLLLAQLRRVIRRERENRDQPVQIWSFAPDAAFLAGAFNEEAFVYYCVDEFSAFEGYDRDATIAAERKLIERSDVVLTTSQCLFDARREQHPRVHLARHGVAYEHFAGAVEGPLPLPQPLHGIPHPIAGFIGLVQHWFDVELMRAVAESMPDMSFVIVGEKQVDVSALERLANVHFVGRQPFAELPAYCAAFDVGLIPFVRSHMTEHVNPIKLREYLAAGLPVVSTDLPEVRDYAPDVICADDPQDFATACRSAVDLAGPAKRRARSARIAGESWDAVTDRVSRLVVEAIEAKQGGLPGDDVRVPAEIAIASA